MRAIASLQEQCPAGSASERLAAVGIKGRDAMPCAFLVILRVWIAFALLGQHMDDDRSLMLLGHLEHLDELREIMPVDGSDINPG